jgi:hypothetical protein
MLGQGRPTLASETPRALPEHRMCRTGRIVRGAIAVCAVWLLPVVALAGEPTMRLRIAWDNQQPRQWQARVSLSEGTLSKPVTLGLGADVPGSSKLTGDSLEILQRSPRRYDGVDVDVSAPLDATLHLELTPLDAQSAAKTSQVKLQQLVSDHHKMPLDEEPDSLVVNRAPGDRLRILFDKSHLVFSPGDEFQFDLAPQLLGFSGGTSVELHVELVNSLTGDSLWSHGEKMKVGDDGTLGRMSAVKVPLPEQEGVYHLVATATRWRLRAPFVPAKPSFQRKLQLVVIDGQPRPTTLPALTATTLQVDIDPTSSKWWERFTRRPQLAVIPGWGRGPLGNVKASKIEHNDLPWIQVEAGGWQAYPLPVTHPGQPHLLEIEYPNDIRQTLGISIVEPDVTGRVAPLGLDSGIDVTPLPTEVESGTSLHRLPFWPRTKTPLVLLTNYRGDGPAVYGRIRVYEGLGHNVPPAERGKLPRRLAAAFFEKPFFTKNFSATQARDPSTGWALDDWATFYQGGRRLVKYLHYSGQNAAVISAACDGSGLYPSKLLQPTPKYDSGTFFSEGRDPIRKDVLEMLLQMFDRAQLTLIPGVEFATPLPELEKQLHDEEQAHGIEWVGDDGKTWGEAFGSRGGLAPYYNPLDDRVQQAMVRVIRELADRYGHHPSFGGVALSLHPQGYAHLPGSAWGFDDRTIAKFSEDTKTVVPGMGDDRFATRQDHLSGEGKKEWLQWRAERLAALYGKMAMELTQTNDDARLFLVASGLLEGQTVQMAMRPALPRRYKLAQALYELGIDPDHYRQDRNVMLLRPQRFAPVMSLVEQAVSQEIETTPAVDRLFEAESTGSVFYHDRLEKRLPSFDEVSPFGKENTRTHLYSHVVPAGPERRKRLVHSLASLDAQVAFEGGWLLPLGQEDAIRDVLDTFCRLPAAGFQTYQPKAPPEGHDTQPVTVRTLASGAGTYIYLVNDSPWPATVDVEFDASETCTAKPLSPLRPVPPLTSQPGGATWTVELRPYDLVGAVLTNRKVEVRDVHVRVSDEVIAQLKRSIRDIGDRVDSLRIPKPMPVLENAGFEKPLQDENIPGWRTAPAPETSVSLAHGQGQGGAGQALKLTSDGPVVWVRSQPITVPQTGRLHVAVWLRAPQPIEQPLFRLAVDGQHRGRPYYRYAEVGGESAPLTDNWSPYVFQVNDLPVNGWDKLEIGFDLMGKGEVLVDEVRVYDKRFNPNEQRELSGAWVALADVHLRQGKLGDCQRVLESYWPRFMLTYVPPPNPRVARNPQPPRPAAPPSQEEEQDEDAPSVRQRLRGALKFW